MKYFVRIMAAIAGTCILLAAGICIILALSPPGWGWLENIVFHNRMARFVPEFDRLNAEVLSQLPVYPRARQVRARAGGAHDPLTPTPRTFATYFVSDDTPSQIYQFFESEMIAQGWQTGEKSLVGAKAIAGEFWKGYACVDFWATLWDNNAETFTHFEPSSSDEIPVSRFKLSIQHDLEAVPGAPVPPESRDAFRCEPGSR